MSASGTGTRVWRPSRNGSPSVASTVPSAAMRRMPASPNASRVRDTRAGTALSPRRTLPATVASISDSAAERAAERARRAAWSTIELTRIAFSTYRTSAHRCSGSAIRTV